MTEPLDVNLNLVRGMLNDLLDLEDDLMDREINFLDSIHDRLESGPLRLSDQQIAMLYKLWSEHFQ